MLPYLWFAVFWTKWHHDWQSLWSPKTWGTIALKLTMRPSSFPAFRFTADKKYFCMAFTGLWPSFISSLCDFAKVYRWLVRWLRVWFKSLHFAMGCGRASLKRAIVVASSSMTTFLTTGPWSYTSLHTDTAMAGSMLLLLPVKFIAQWWSGTGVPWDSCHWCIQHSFCR